MGWLYFVAAIVIIIAIAVAVFRQTASRAGERLALNSAKEIFPVWAALGPFKDGTESAVAMAYAFITVCGPEFARDQISTFKKHAEVFNEAPEKWEEVQKVSLQNLSNNYSQYIEAATKLRDGTADREDEKTVTAIALETIIRGNSDKFMDYVFNESN